MRQRDRLASVATLSLKQECGRDRACGATENLFGERDSVRTPCAETSGWPVAIHASCQRTNLFKKRVFLFSARVCFSETNTGVIEIFPHSPRKQTPQIFFNLFWVSVSRPTKLFCNVCDVRVHPNRIRA